MEKTKEILTYKTNESKIYVFEIENNFIELKRMK